MTVMVTRRRLSVFAALSAFGALACVAEPPTEVDGAGQPDAPPLPHGDASELPPISFDDYHTQEEIAAYLRDVADAAPDLTTFEVLGESSQGREIALLMVNATGEPDPPAVFANGTHHGDESSSTESVLGVIDYMLRHRDVDPDVAELLDTYAFYFVPLVNPDGHAGQSRWDAYGRDPNRDYLIPTRSEDDAFQLVETRLVRDLQLRAEFRAALAFHSGTIGVLWPWGFDDEPTPHHDLFYTTSKACAEAMGMDRYFQSVELFPAEGEYCDYAYMVHDTLCVTVEVSDIKRPPVWELEYYVDLAVSGTIAYVGAIMDNDRGALTIEPELEIHFGSKGQTAVVNGQKLE